MTKIKIFCNNCKNTIEECDLVVRYEEDIYLSKKNWRTPENPIITKWEFCPHCRKMLTDNWNMVNWSIINENIYTIQDKTTIIWIDHTNWVDRNCKIEWEMKNWVLNINKIDYE